MERLMDISLLYWVAIEVDVESRSRTGVGRWERLVAAPLLGFYRTDRAVEQM